jgi:hypothetical protein
MKNSAFSLRNCLLCALIFEKKLKFFIKFTFLKIFKFLLLKKWDAQLIRGRRVFEKIRYPVFYTETINSETDVRQMLRPFFKHLTDEIKPLWTFPTEFCNCVYCQAFHANL